MWSRPVAPMDLCVQVSTSWFELEESGYRGSPLSEQDAMYRHYFDKGCTNATGMSESMSAISNTPVHVDQSGSSSNM